MRLPRFRFTVRRMMIGVAISALLVCCGLKCADLWNTSLLYRREAKSWEKAEKSIRQQAAYHKAREGREAFRSIGTIPFEQRLGAGIGVQPKFSDRSRILQEQADIYARRKSKFERAAWFPWLPLEPE
jgi:hypothetical protein